MNNKTIKKRKKEKKKSPSVIYMNNYNENLNWDISRKNRRKA
jgi:hypothetical protein